MTAMSVQPVWWTLSYTAARAVVAYDGHSREMILAFKHGDQTHLTTTFGPWLGRVDQPHQAHGYSDGGAGTVASPALVAAALQPSRVISPRDLAKREGLSFRPDILRRQRTTVPYHKGI